MGFIYFGTPCTFAAKETDQGEEEDVDNPQSGSPVIRSLGKRFLLVKAGLSISETPWPKKLFFTWRDCFGR